ncbi:MAG: hypothetical protein BWY01_01521 [Synergistetes bacterium ADurb.Bin155]|nr:MAG: hypothetical protein BWY01_01521 [Synergistetes bacterium ADurb.Bin155]
MNRRKIFLGETPMTRSGAISPTMAIPETLSVILRRERFLLPIGEIAALSGRGNALAADTGLWALSQEGKYILAAPASPVLAAGGNWLLAENALVVGETPILAAMPTFPVMVAGKAVLLDSGLFDATGMAPWAAGVIPSPKAFSLGRVLIYSGELLFDLSQFRRAELSLLMELWGKDSPVFRYLKKENDELPPPVNVGRDERQYGIQPYDCTDEGLVPANVGGFWRDGEDLCASGALSAGRGYLVGTMFDAEGRCVAFASVQGGEVRSKALLVIAPAPGGVLYGTARSENPMGRLLPVSSVSLRRWEEEESVVAAPTGWIDPTAGFGGPPLALTEWTPGKAACVSFEKWVPPWDGSSPGVHGWIAPGAPAPVGALGKMLMAAAPGGNVTTATEIPLLRRYVVPGVSPAVSFENGRMTLIGCTAGMETLERTTIQTALPVPKSLTQELRAGDISLPLAVHVGEAFQLGWWNWPERGIIGSIPRPENFGDNRSGNDWNNYSDDGRRCTVAEPRKSISATSDGYLYLAWDQYGPTGRVDYGFGLSALRYSGNEWERHDNVFPADGSTGVQTGGRGSYSVYHYPGADWSLFHAPACDIEYFSPWFSIDWSWLSGLSPFLGGIASALIAAEQIAQETYGNLQWITHHPRNVVYVGDPLFGDPERVKLPSNTHWRFIDWWVHEETLYAALAGWKSSNTTPEMWLVNRKKAFQASAASMEELYQRAIDHPPGVLFPRLVQKFKAEDPFSLAYESSMYGSGLWGTELNWGLIDESQTKVKEVYAALKEFYDNAEKPLAPAWGSVSNHNLFSYMAVDGELPPLRDTTAVEDWLLVRELSGVWFGAQNAAARGLPPSVTAQDTAWWPVSMGWRGRQISLLLARGKCDQAIGDMDDFMIKLAALTGERGHPSHRYDLWYWPDQFLPVLIDVDAEQLARLRQLATTKG